MSLVLNGTTGITNLTSINSGQIGGRRNKIINGAMEINQRGTSATATNATYISDRWRMAEAGGGNLTCQVVADAPAGFRNSIKAIASTADDCSQTNDEYAVNQHIEGNNIVDLYFGNTGAKTVTLSFWVKSSLTGDFSCSIHNSSLNRSLAKQYNIAQANTWEQKSVVLSGDEGGTWAIDSGIGIRLTFNLGAGSAQTGTLDAWQGSRVARGSSTVQFMATVNATWFITGVQLEVGSTATDFEYRNLSEELALCERYYQLVPQVGLAYAGATTTVDTCCPFRTTMRATPTMSAIAAITVSNVTASDFAQSSANITGSVSVGASSAHLRLGNFSGLTTSDMYLCRNGDMNIAADAEL
tara:strand:- start:1605 stop:2672 length:1068 start_codon:yes stop_codon:yes gene_type:complete